MDLYTYCDNDPVNWIDPYGLYVAVDPEIDPSDIPGMFDGSGGPKPGENALPGAQDKGKTGCAKKKKLPFWVFAIGAFTLATPVPGDEAVVWIGIGIAVIAGGYAMHEASKGPRPEPYPGYEKGKRDGQYSKSHPKPAPPAHNQPPDIDPEDPWWKKLLKDMAALLDALK